MRKIEELLVLYRTLCQHCDRIAGEITTRRINDIVCRPGCSSCCTIRSVTKLEALAIEEYIQVHGLLVPAREQGERCFFLQNGLCSIYPVRPVICRTHGLILYDSQDESFSRTCTLNFTDVTGASIERRDTVDVVNITENLIRLNLALLKLTGVDHCDPGRVSLEEIAEKLSHQSEVESLEP